MDPTPPPSIAPLDPRRSATHTVYGFLYQTALAVERWLQLNPGEWIFCEGDEDFDLLAPNGERTAVQAKAYSGRLGLNDAAVKESLIGFRNAFVARRRAGQQQRFQFVTTASAREQGEAAVVLESWRNKLTTPEVVAFVRTLVNDDTDAARWLDDVPERWNDYVAAVSWSFDTPDLDRILRQIEKTLAGDLRSRHLPSPLIARRLLYELLDASRQREPKHRCRSADDLAALLRSTQQDLESWAADPRVNERLRELFDARNLAELLVPGTRSLPARDHLRSVGQLLGAAYEAVPWNDQLHEDVVKELQEWCNPRETIEVQVMVGDGGTGKTRLGIELVKRLRHAGWQAGFLSDLPAMGTQVSADNEDYFREKAFRLLRGTAPRLVVIDYAETHASWIAMLLQVVCDARSQGITAPVRLLLLARNAQEWWLAVGNRRPAVNGLQREIRIRDLAAVRLDGPVREGLFWQAVQMYSQMLGKPPTGAPPDISTDEFQRVLYVHMAALALVEGTTVRGREHVLRATLEHERRFWSRAIERHEVAGERRALERAFPGATTAMTLIQGAVDEAEAYRYLGRAVTKLGPKDEDVKVPALVGLLRTVYSAEDRGGGEARFLAAVEPDVLGEFLIADVLTVDAAEPRHPGETRQLLDVLFPEPWDENLMPAFVVVGRAAAEDARHDQFLARLLQPHVELRSLAAVRSALAIGAKTAHSPIGRVVVQVLGDRAAPELARVIETILPEHSVSLREVAGWASSQLVKAVKAASIAEDEGELARVRNNQSVRLAELGHREDALLAAQEAVAVYRRLAAQRPDAFEPDLAMSLNNLGNMLSELGRREDALLAAQEAVVIRRRLAAQRPDAFEPYLAASLNNLGNRLSELGRREDALLAAQEAVAVYRRLAAQRPDAFEPDLAMSLNNLGAMLSELGRREDALLAAQEAVAVYRRLAAQRPDAFEPYLAASLNNLGNMLSELGRREDALLAAQEAVTLYARLTELRPLAFSRNAAIAARSYLARAQEAGRQPDAVLLTRIAHALQNAPPPPQS